MTVGDQIRYFRNIKNLSVNKLAKLAGISQSYLRDIELQNKNPTIEVLSRICDALDLSLQDFFSEGNQTDVFEDALYQKIMRLSKEQKEALAAFLDAMLNQEAHCSGKTGKNDN